MGGCCCHNDDVSDDDEASEDKCIMVVKEEEEKKLSPTRRYGAVSMKDTEDTRNACRGDNDQDKMNGCSVGQFGIDGVQVESDDGSQSNCKTKDVSSEDGIAEHDSDSSSTISSKDLDNEIDQLVEAAMAAKVVYPPTKTMTTGAEEKPPSQKTLSLGASHEPGKVDTASKEDEKIKMRMVSTIMNKTQISLGRAKARAKSMVAAPMTTTGEEAGRSKKLSNETYHQMKSTYARDRVAKFEVERTEKDKQATRKSNAVDPRKVAMERGERLGELDDVTEGMRDQSASFGDTARRLRDDKRSRTTTFPW